MAFRRCLTRSENAWLTAYYRVLRARMGFLSSGRIVPALFCFARHPRAGNNRAERGDAHCSSSASTSIRRSQPPATRDDVTPPNGKQSAQSFPPRNFFFDCEVSCRPGFPTAQWLLLGGCHNCIATLFVYLAYPRGPRERAHRSASALVGFLACCSLCPTWQWWLWRSATRYPEKRQEILGGCG